jgi:hypothetical protein
MNESECMIMGQVCKWKPQKGKNKRKSFVLNALALAPFLWHFNTLHHRQSAVESGCVCVCFVCARPVWQ